MKQVQIIVYIYTSIFDTRLNFDKYFPLNPALRYCKWGERMDWVDLS